jgi:RTX calcium-binding nonapeptide repeat (4 copies)
MQSFRRLIVLAGCIALLYALCPLPGLAAHVDHEAAMQQPPVHAGEPVELKAPRCHGEVATIVRGPGNDRIIGTRRRDVIVAGGGRDVVLGLGGNDVICLGPGADAADGQAGVDPIFGGPARTTASPRDRPSTDSTTAARSI